MTLLVVEDGHEYSEFVAVFLREHNAFRASSAAEALTLLGAHAIDALLMDLRWTQGDEAALCGDLEALATRLFAGDRQRARHYLLDHQGTFILEAVRAAGHHQPALFINDMAPQRLANLRKLYGDVRAVPRFDAQAMRAALGSAT